MGFRGNGSNGDIAIDDLEIFEADLYDIEMNAIIAPKPGICGYTSSDDVTIEFTNQGALALDTVPFAYQLDNNPIVFDTLFARVEPGADTSYTFSTPLDLSAIDTFNLTVWANLNTDSNIDNDTISGLRLIHVQAINTFPYTINFESSTPGNGSTDPGTLSFDEWTSNPAASSTAYSWYVQSGITPTGFTGTICDHTVGKGGNYLYTEANNGLSPAVAAFQSTCIDFTGLNSPVLDFYYHMYGLDILSLAVQVKTDNTAGWSNELVLNGGTQIDVLDPWEYARVDLSAYADSVVKIRFLARKDGNLSDIAIDDIVIYDQGTTDVGVYFLERPGAAGRTGNSPAPQVEIRNYGSTTVNNIPVEYSYTPLYGTNAGVTQTHSGTYTGSLTPGSTVLYTFPATNLDIPLGEFEFCAYTQLAGDAHAFNDTACKLVSGSPRLPLPFSDNLDTGNLYFHAKNEGFKQWEYGTPSANVINSAHSGNTVWALNLDGDYVEGSDEFLYFPTIDKDTLKDIELRFWHWLHTDATGADGGRVEYKDAAGNWLPLDAPNAQIGTNWYSNSTYGSSTIGALDAAANSNSGVGWTGNSGGWQFSSFPLSQFNNSQTFDLRFRFASDPFTNGNGWAVDDIELYVPPQVSAAAVSITTEAPLPLPGDNLFIIRVENAGACPLESVVVRLEETGIGTIDTDTLTFNPPLLRGQTRGHKFLTPWNVSSGNHDFVFIHPCLII